MEQALVLGTLAFSFPREMIDELKNMPGVTDANFIYGPYDFYVMVRTDSKEELGQVVVRIRNIDGVKSTMTCNVLSMPVAERSPKE